jgi:tRNA threonylcarbamoyladenosine biosynthesis protein TsaB
VSRGHDGRDLTLALDAATYTATVAIISGSDVVAVEEVAMRGEHEERLMPAVAAALQAAGVTVRDVHRIVCGAGPGSFTSLRIAAAIAKGIATATGAPLYAVSSLALVVAGSPSAAVPGRYLAVLDAMRGEAYVSGYEVGDGGAIEEIAPLALVPRAEVEPCAERLGARAIGPGERLVAVPHARGVARLGGRFAESGPVSLAEWEPAYGRLAEAQVRWERAHGRPLPRE